jgi:hypothetical protein
MYKSKSEIEKKLKQAKYVYKEISKFKNRIFVNNGLDEETGSYPLLTHVSSFLAHARSILQYAQKEAKESGIQSKYDNYVSQNKIIKFFKTIRNSEIHEYTIGSHMTITGESPIVSYDSETHTAIGKKVEFYVEPLSDINSPKYKNKEVEITTALSKKIIIDNAFIQKLEAEGKKDLAAAARNGKELYEEQKCEGEKDIFKLCENYIKELELFINFGITNGFIT